MMGRTVALVLVLFFVAFLSPVAILGVAPDATPSGAVTAGITLDYRLPYPGILPDSPLYFFKVVRDQFMLLLIREPVQRAYYLLLLSDKRLVSGKMLMERGKLALGMETISKGEDYFKQAVDTAVGIKKQSPAASDVLAKLVTAAAKHDEVIANLLGTMPRKGSLVLEKAYWQNQSNRNRVNDFVLSRMLPK